MKNVVLVIAHCFRLRPKLSYWQPFLGVCELYFNPVALVWLVCVHNHYCFVSMGTALLHCRWKIILLIFTGSLSLPSCSLPILWTTSMCLHNCYVLAYQMLCRLQQKWAHRTSGNIIFCYHKWSSQWLIILKNKMQFIHWVLKPKTKCAPGLNFERLYYQ